MFPAFTIREAKAIFDKESILEKVWGLDGQFVDDNTVTVIGFICLVTGAIVLIAISFFVQIDFFW